jgi:hypothetical protein
MSIITSFFAVKRITRKTMVAGRCVVVEDNALSRRDHPLFSIFSFPPTCRCKMTTVRPDDVPLRKICPRKKSPAQDR